MSLNNLMFYVISKILHLSIEMEYTVLSLPRFHEIFIFRHIQHLNTFYTWYFLYLHLYLNQDKSGN